MPEPGTAPASSDCPAVRSQTLFRRVEYPNLPTLREKLADKTGKTSFRQLASHGMNGAFHLDILCTNSGGTEHPREMSGTTAAAAAIAKRGPRKHVTSSRKGLVFAPAKWSDRGQLGFRLTVTTRGMLRMPKVSELTFEPGRIALTGWLPGRRVLRMLPLVAVMLASTVSCGGDSDPSPGDKEGLAKPVTTPSAAGAKSDQPNVDGLVTLVNTNLSVFDVKTGKETVDAFLPHDAKPNVWKREAFSPDWRNVVWTTGEGELFIGDYTDVGRGNGLYGRNPSRIAGRPTYSGGKPGYAQPRFGPDGTRVYFLANDETVYSADPKKPEDLKKELALPEGSFSADDELTWDVTAAGSVVKAKAVQPKKTLEATSADGTKTIIHTDHGWFLKEKGSSAEPKLLFEELVTSDGEPVAVDTGYGLRLDVIGWY